MKVKQSVKYENHKYIITTTAKNYYHTSSIDESRQHEYILRIIDHDHKKCKEHLPFVKVCNKVCKYKSKDMEVKK